MELLNNDKNRMIVRVMRLLMMATFLFRGFLAADGVYNANMTSIAGVGSGMMYAAILIGSAIGSGLLAWLATSLSFTLFTRSAYGPTRQDGVSSISYCTYHGNAYMVLTISNIIVGLLSLIAFFNNVLSALMILVIAKIVTIFTIILFDVLIGRKFAGKDAKRFISAVTFPNIIMMLLF